MASVKVNGGEIQGVEYTKMQTEYQYFPEEYFTGQDVTIYFDDIWMDDLTGLQFRLSESVMPVFGYNSYRFDAVARGARIVQGSFRIAFKEAGYLYRIFEHIGGLKEKARPKIAYLLGGEEVPKWLAGIKEDAQTMLERYDPEFKEAEKKAAEAAKFEGENWSYMKIGDRYDQDPKVPSVKGLNQLIVRETKAFYDGKGVRLPGLVGTVPRSITKDMKMGDKGPHVKEMQLRLIGYYREWDPKFFCPVDGVFDYRTQRALKRWQREFSLTLQNEYGFVGPRTRQYLNASLLNTTSVFTGVTKLALLRYQHKNKLPLTGQFDAKTKESMKWYLTVKNKPTSPIEFDYADYESSIWGDDRTIDERDVNTYFYSGKNQEWLKYDGFDVYINYGPLPEVILQKNKVPDKVPFNTTVRAIRNIQIQDFETVYDANGTPIEEVYYFVARDID